MKTFYIIFGCFAVCMSFVSYFSSAPEITKSNYNYMDSFSDKSQQAFRFREDAAAYRQDLEESHTEIQGNSRPAYKAQASQNMNNTNPSFNSYNPKINTAKVVKHKIKKTKKKKRKKKTKKVATKKKTNAEKSDLPDIEDEIENNYDQNNFEETYAQALPQQQKDQNNNSESGADEEDEEDLNNFEAWREPIFVNEEKGAVDKLISSFKDKSVSNGVYYKVVEEMISDAKDSIREAGVYALGETPSTQSFSFLSKVNGTDGENDDLKKVASQQMDRYATSNKKVNYVVSALNIEDNNLVTKDAIRILKKTISLVQPRAQGEGTPVGIDVEQAQASLIQAAQLLESNHLESSDATIRNQAQQTVEAIRNATA